MTYRTPKGKDESLVPLSDEYSEYEDRITAHKYLNGVLLRGGNFDEGVLKEITSKMSRNKSVVVNMTGPPGVGKTWLAIALALLYDPKFHILDTPRPAPEQDHGQVCFTREHILYLIGENSPLKPGQAIVLDEAHFGMGARGFQNKNQIGIVNLISAIRSKGFMLIIVTLHSTMLDKIPREYVVNYEFGVSDHGRSKPYFKWFPTMAKKPYYKGKPVLNLPMPDAYDPDTDTGCDDPSCLRCPLTKATGKKRCFNIRSIYERRKNGFINEMSKNGEEETKNSKYLPFDEIIKAAAKHGVKTVYKGNGEIHQSKTLANYRRAGYKIRNRQDGDFIDHLIGAIQDNPTEKTP